MKRILTVCLVCAGFCLLFLQTGAACFSATSVVPSDLTDTVWYPIPEFLFNADRGFLTQYNIDDTIFRFDFFDSRDSLITCLGDPDDIGFISLIKSYTDSQNTYTDNEGRKQFLPISSIIVRYDRVDDEHWIKIDYRANKYSKLTVFSNERTAIDPFDIRTLKTGNNSTQILRFYFCRVREQ